MANNQERQKVIKNKVFASEIMRGMEDVITDDAYGVFARTQFLSLMDVIVRGRSSAELVFSAIGLNKGDAIEDLKWLKSQKGIIRMCLASKISCKYMPDLVFKLNTSELEERQIDQILASNGYNHNEGF